MKIRGHRYIHKERLITSLIDRVGGKWEQGNKEGLGVTTIAGRAPSK